MENITQMRERHKNEISILQENCFHESISECMPFAWAIGHISHCVKVCNICGKVMFTTSEGTWGGNIINETPENEFFKCPKREDCSVWYRGEE